MSVVRTNRSMKGIYHVLGLLLVLACKDTGVSGTVGDCPDGMIAIEAGDYLLGRTVPVPKWDPGVTPAAPSGYWSLPNPAAVVRVESFCLDRYEYPNEKGTLPRTRVTWREAQEACEALGKRLPTRTEWQAAAQGPKGWLYSYGPRFEVGRCNTDQEAGAFEKLATSGAYPRCHSAQGVYDLNGNLSEWVSDSWEGPWYSNEVWGGPSDQTATLMGGTAWVGDAYGQDSTSRHRHRAGERWDDDGFRCALTTP